MGLTESEKFKKETEPNTAEDKEKRMVLVVEDDLNGLGFSREQMRLVLEKLNELCKDGKVKTVEDARHIAPELDLPAPKFKEINEKRPKPPRHTKRKGEKY